MTPRPLFCGTYVRESGWIMRNVIKISITDILLIYIYDFQILLILNSIVFWQAESY
jgi:hypothetical protein